MKFGKDRERMKSGLKRGHHVVWAPSQNFEVLAKFSQDNQLSLIDIFYLRWGHVVFAW